MTYDEFLNLYESPLREKIKRKATSYLQAEPGKLSAAAVFEVRDLLQDAWERIWARAKAGESESYYLEIADNIFRDKLREGKTAKRIANNPKNHDEIL